MDLMGNALILLKRVLMETEDGYRLRMTTRKAIQQQIEVMEKDKKFLTELIPQKGQ